MTEDDITTGLNHNNVLTGEPFDPVPPPAYIESLIATLPTGAAGAGELWKLNHYYERLDDWNTDHGITANPFAAPAAEADRTTRSQILGEAVLRPRSWSQLVEREAIRDER
jgi:hypothetical protein